MLGMSAEVQDRTIEAAPGVAAPAGFRWHVIHTRSRQEKAVAEVLAGSGGTPYLPLYRRVMYYGHRKRVVESPLFSCYLFLWGLREHAYPAFSAKRVAQLIAVPDQTTFISQLAQVRLVLAAGGELGPYRYLTKGRRVRVMAGPFQGVEGVVDDLLRQDRLILKIHAIGRALSLEIDASLLEPVE
jgi:hypothetical protein